MTKKVKVKKQVSKKKEAAMAVTKALKSIEKVKTNKDSPKPEAEESKERDFKSEKDALFESIELLSNDIEDLEMEFFELEEQDDEDEASEREEMEEAIENKKDELKDLREELIQVLEDEKDLLDLEIEYQQNQIDE